MVTDYAPAIGGTASQSRLEASQLVGRGWQVAVLTRRLSLDWPKAEVLDDVTVDRVGRPGYSRVSKFQELASAWWALLTRYRTVDVIQALMDPDYVVAARLAGLGGRVCLMWATLGDAERMLAGPLGWVRRIALRGCPQIVLTDAMDVELSEVLGIHADAVIPVPVDGQRFRPASESARAARRREFAISADLVIVFTGHLIRRKAVDRLLEAFAAIADHDVDAHLLLVGSGVGRFESIEDQLRAFAAEHDLGSRVSFVGAVGDVRPYLEAADVFCLPSWREGMPNSILEAMACGLVCVAPASAGGEELLRDGAGVIPSSNSVEDLFAALMPLADSSELRRKLGSAAHSRVTEKYGVAGVVDAYERVWSSIDLAN